MEPLGPGDPASIGAYRLLSRLGEGGMGRVYLARSPRGRIVAVKTIQPALAREPDFRKRFTQEIAAARRVGGAWTAPVLDADTEAAMPWVATGYIAGPTLHRVVAEDYGPLPERALTFLAAGLTQALHDIHDTGLIHRDLKPSNVLITFDGPRVIDFGIARALDAASAAGLTRAGAIIGSPGFMSPEQIRGERLTAASDVFSLGTILAYAATGKLPFGTEDSGGHALMFRIVETEAELDGVPDGPLAELIRDCLRKDPVLRPTVADLLARTAADAEPHGEWLPAEVLAQLGRHAVALLDGEDPAGETDETDEVDTPGTAGTGGTGGTAGGAGTAGTAGAAGTAGTITPSAATPNATSAPTIAGHPTPTPTRHIPEPTPLGPTPHTQPPPNGPTTPPPPPPASPPPSPPSAVPAASAPGPVGTTRPWTPAPWPSPPPSSKVPTDARRIGWPAYVLYGLLTYFAASLLYVLGTYSDLLEEVTAWRDQGLPFSIHHEKLVQRADHLDEFVLKIADYLFLAVLVVWLIWFWRVRRNAEVFAPGHVRHSPLMAVVCCLVPLVNLVLPKRIAVAILFASQPPPGHQPWQAGAPVWQPPYGLPRPSLRLVHAWWALLLLYVLPGLFGVSQWWQDGHDYASTRTLVALACVQKCVGMGAALTAIAFVHRLTDLQNARVAALARR